MKKTKSEADNTVIMSDKYLSESGVQGGKVIADYIVLFSFILGIPFFIMGLAMLLGFGFPSNTAVILGALLLFVIGSLLIVGGYFIYRDKHSKN